MPDLSQRLKRGVGTLLDQALVSGARFSVMLTLGRVAGAESLGCYALGMAALTGVMAIQEAMLLTPYTAQVHGLHVAKRRAFRRLVLQRANALWLAASVVCCIVAGILKYLGSGLEVTLTFLQLAWCLPLISYRDFLRRLDLAEQRSVDAFQIDARFAAGLVVSLGVLVYRDTVSAPMVVVALAFASTVAVIPNWVAGRRDRRGGNAPLDAMSPEKEMRSLRPTSQASQLPSLDLRFGTATLVGMLATQLSWQVVGWIVAYELSTASLGHFTACLSIVFLTNPVVLGINNLLAPEIARRLAEESQESAKRYVYRACALMCVMMTGFLCFVVLFGDRCLNVLYGDEYAGSPNLLQLLAVSVAVLATFLPIDDVLWATGRPRVNAIASVIGLTVTLTAAALMTQTLGLTAAGIALLLGSIAESIIRLPAFLQSSASLVSVRPSTSNTNASTNAGVPTSPSR